MSAQQRPESDSGDNAPLPMFRVAVRNVAQQRPESDSGDNVEVVGAVVVVALRSTKAGV